MRSPVLGFDQILKATIEQHKLASLVYVGSSDNDTTQLWPFPDAKNTIWISSSSNLQEKIKEQPQKSKNIVHHFEYISKQSGTIDFYDASLGEFSGSINPTAIKPYWQNIKTVKTTKRAVTTLDKLQSKNSKIHSAWLSANWMIIDQLAALDTLKGGQGFLPQLDGMIIKVFLPDQSSCAPEMMTSSTEQISEWLKPHNFTAVAQKTGRHKSFAHVLFVRNWKAEYESLSIKNEEGKSAIHDVSRLNDKLKEQLAAQQQTISELTEEQISTQESQEKLESKIEANLERIATLNNEKENLKSQLVSAQDVSLQKEKQAELHLQNLEFLQEKFKDVKKGYDDNIELLKNIQAKLLGAVQNEPAKRSGGNKTQNQN